MGMCPLCNGFGNIKQACPNCSESMKNEGREADYYDDYSPYMPIDQMKLEDGYPSDFAEEKCPHLFKCPNCGTSKVFLIKE
jgi:hypothetical protein